MAFAGRQRRPRRVRAGSRATRAARSPGGSPRPEQRWTRCSPRQPRSSCGRHIRGAHRAPGPHLLVGAGPGARAHRARARAGPRDRRAGHREPAGPRRDGPGRRRAHRVAARPDGAGARGAPMNDAMYAHPATRANLNTLAARGWVFVARRRARSPEGPSDRPGRMSGPKGSSPSRSGCCCSARPLAGEERGRDPPAHPRASRPVRVVTTRRAPQGYALAEAPMPAARTSSSSRDRATCRCRSG